MSKQYLTGELTPKEKYQVEDRLLENDFSYEAVEGLEQLSWDECQQHLLDTESRIVEEFSLSQNSLINKNTMITITGLVISGLLAVWYFIPSNDTIDMSNKEIQETQKPPPEIKVEPLQEPEVEDQEIADSLQQSQVEETEIPGQKVDPVNPAPVKPMVDRPQSDASVETHITVGRGDRHQRIGHT